MNLTDCIQVAQRGFNAWAGKEHNRRWFRKVDGTPIPNDVTVNIAEAFHAAQPSDLDIEMAVGGAYEVGDRRFWIDAPVAREIVRRVQAVRPADLARTPDKEPAHGE